MEKISVKEFSNKTTIRSVLLIFLGFFMTSTAWIAWEYHLLDQVEPTTSDVCTMIAGYTFQALGIAFYALLERRNDCVLKTAFYAALVIHSLCLLPAATGPYVAGTLVFGFLMNAACGVIAAAYLRALGAYVPSENKGTAFGAGYALAILSTWLLSLADRIYYSPKILIVCYAATLLIFIIYRIKAPETYDHVRKAALDPDGRSLGIAAVLVLLFSMVNSSGFAFPSADIGVNANLELSRLAYAAGLVVAGIVTDRSRKYGALLALSALMIPFIILALRGESVSAYVFWLLSYFAFGFYAVYRIIIFSDIASKNGVLYLSGFGLMFGRIGDAAGEALCMALRNHITLLVIISAGLFAAVVFVFFREYGRLYAPESKKELSEQEKIRRFAMQHDLSTREKDVFRLLLEEHNNSEIADILFISENTVKYHIKNLLSKTGCKNRKELAAAFMTYFD